MKIDKFLDKLHIFEKNLKNTDEKLYYEFLHLYDNFIEQTRKEIEESKRQGKKINNILIKLSLNSQRTDEKLHDLSIDNEVSYEKYKKELYKIINNKSKEIVDRYCEKLTNIQKAIFNKPRTNGFFLLLFGRKHLGIVQKFKLTDQTNGE